MSTKVVRSSKYRHVFGTVAKKEQCWDGLKPSKSSWDSNKVTVSTKFAAFIWEASGGGSVAVFDTKQPAKRGQHPRIKGHSGDILDIEFSPFNPNLLASVSEDGTGKIWSIPEGGLVEDLLDPVQTLSGHKRKVGTVNFHPTANNVVVTTSGDFKAKVWDIETGKEMFDVPGHGEMVNSLSWDYLGNSFFTAAKDKKIRLCDPRSSSIVTEFDAHTGIKGMRVLNLGNKEKLYSTGFSKASDRQYAIWDPKNLSAPLKMENVDTSSGILMPFFDDDTNVLYVAGRGDGNIRYYEIVDDAPYIHSLSEFKSNVPQKGLAFTPKLAMNLASCEIARPLKLTTTTLEPIHFCVPRKSDIFQDDLYPPTFSGVSSVSADEWASGAEGKLNTCELSFNFVPPETAQTDFQAVVVEQKKERSVKELTEENEKFANRISYLEAEVAKRDARIKDLESNQ